MAPRKSTASRGKRPVAPEIAERRTKRRNDTATQPPQPASTLPPSSKMGIRQVTSGRKVDLDFLDREGFRIGGWIRQQHWERFCSIDLPYYPALVRQFYENMSLGYECICSTVKGVDIVINENFLSRLLAIPSRGKCFMTLNKKEEGLKVILERESNSNLKNLQANLLSVEMRVLHSIVSRVFFPKTGRFDWINEKDTAFMYFMISGEPINLPYLLLAQIKDASRKQKACLPYGMIFTLMFNEFNINLDGETSKRLLHTDYYTEMSLHRMGFVKKNNQWVKKRTGQGDEETDSEDPDQIPAETAADLDDEADDGADESLDASAHAEKELQTDSDHRAEGEDTGPTVAPVTSPPRVPQEESVTEDSAHISSLLSAQLSQFTDSLRADMRSLLGDLRQDMSQLRQQVTQSYDEVRGDIRDLTMRVEVLEQHHRSRDTLLSEITDLRSDFGRMRGAADTFVLAHAGSISTVDKKLDNIELGLEILMGTTSSSSRARPQATPRASSQSRPPPHSTSRPPRHSTSRAQRGRGSTRKSTVHAPHTVASSDSDTSSSE